MYMYNMSGSICLEHFICALGTRRVYANSSNFYQSTDNTKFFMSNGVKAIRTWILTTIWAFVWKVLEAYDKKKRVVEQNIVDGTTFEFCQIYNCTHGYSFSILKEECIIKLKYFLNLSY